MKIKSVSMLLTFFVIIGLFPLIPITAFAEDSSLVLWYKFNETSGSTVSDSSGKNNNGALNGKYSRSTTPDGSGAIELDGSTGYVAMPNGILSGITDITIATRVYVDNSNTNPSWIWTFGSSLDPGSNENTKYLGLLEDGSKKLRASITTKRWSGEQTVSKGAALSKGAWKHITYTLSGTTAILYEDGVQIAKNTNVNLKPSDIESTIANYIGKPAYPADKYFKGKISDFRMYNRALNESEIKTLSNSMSDSIVTKDEETLDLGDLSQITKDIDLPTMGINGSTITWTSSDENVISSTGVVTRPESSAGDKTIKLTANIARGDVSKTKEFTAVVIALKQGEDQKISEAKDQLIIQNADDIRGNITLPKTVQVGKETINITWTTDKPDIVDVNEKVNEGYDNTPAGVITRPDEDTIVKLTATLTHGNSIGTKDIIITVKAKPAQISDSDYKGYLFAYFTDAGRSDAEQTYFSLSKDGLHWDELNDNNPTLTSTVGTKGVRDQFIMRSPEGDKFYLIATDLRIASTDWGTCQRSGSQSVVVWESTDLVNWSNERLVKVARDDAGCTWAPEIVYDDKTGEYVMFWASRVREDNYAKQRIYIAKTRDFYTFTEPEVWIDRDQDVIDTDVIKYNGTYYRFSKDEVDKNIIIDTSNQLLNKDYKRLSSPTVESQKGVEGPAVFKFNNEKKWGLLLDNYGGGGYYPLVSNDIASGEFKKLDTSEYKLPSGPRHGTVMPITQAEYDAVNAKWGENVVKPVEELQTNPILEYKFDETKSDSTIEDNSGNNRTGTLNGNATYTQDGEKGQVLYLDGTVNTFAALPQGFFEGRDTVTISMDVKPLTVSGNFFTFTIGKDSNKYMFLKTMDTTIRNAITTGSWSVEQEVKGTTTSIANKWMNIKLVITPTSMAIFKDGVLINKNENITISMSDLGTDLLAYLGKSFYSEDAYFKGYFDNVRVYNRALSEFEIANEFNENISVLKAVSADGYAIIKNKSDTVNKELKVYFSRNNSTRKDLTAVPLNYKLSDGCTINATDGENVDLTNPISVTITLPDGSQEEWTIEGIISNNPVLGGQFADPDIDVFEDKFYIYPTTDGYSGWSGTQFHAFSSDDIIDWNDEGVIVDAGKDKNVPWAVGSAWAPTIEEKNGKYYFYFCAKRSDGVSCIGVATSDSPTGPFEAESTPLITPEIALAQGVSVGQTIDPSIFTDDDGKSYMLFGNGSAAIVELNDDMISLKSGTMKKINGAKDFRESIIVTKRDGLYHFTWSCDDTGSENYHVNYGISEDLYGPIDYKYTILGKDASSDILGTGHHSILKIPNKDEYYIAYHRFVTPLGQYSSGLGYHRETCIDKLEFDEKTGLMKVVTPTLDGITEPVTLNDSSTLPDYPNKVDILKNDDTLTAELLNEDGSKFTTDVAVKYEWYRDNKLIDEESGTKYNLSDDDKGTKINVKVPQYGLTSDYIYIDDDNKSKITYKNVPDGAYDFSRKLEKGLNSLTADNNTKADNILDAVKPYIEATTSSAVELSMEDYNVDEATYEKRGNITGEIVIDCDDDKSEYGFSLDIPILSSDGAYDFSKAVSKGLKSIIAHNDTESDDILDVVRPYVEATTSSAVELSMEEYNVDEATYEKEGSITGEILINCDDYDSSYEFNLKIAILGDSNEVDKSKLIEFYNAYKNKTQGRYTNYTWSIFVSALNNAEEKINKEDVSQEEIEDAYKELKSAIDGLKLKKKSNNSSESKDSSSSLSTSIDDENVKSENEETKNLPKLEWQLVNEKWYIINNANGTKITGWYNDNGIWYYLNEDGSMAIGWIKDNYGKWYYLNQNGSMATGWILDTDGKWYYLNNLGVMEIGWIKDNYDKWYYLKENGAMAHDEYIDEYYVDSNGVWIE